MRTGKDDQETHESMQINRHRRKYMEGKKLRHPGQNRMNHRDKSILPE